MDKSKNYLTLKKYCLTQGFDLFGVADITGLKKEFFISESALEKIDRAICLAVRLSKGVLKELDNAPTRLYFHHYRTVNTFIDQTALKICSYLQKKGFTAIPIPASQIVDWQKQTAHLSHKKLAVEAGLGWIGRNNLLVNKDLGSQFRLVTILTDMPLKTDKPVEFGCGECRLCMNACPAQAIKDKPAEFEHLLCFEKLKEFQKQRLVDQFICGVCVNLCKGKKK
ncbi:MAG: hypothetical protein PHO70_07100 [Candidatus Omnitrophica bacterium]|nr:hypothetical protein [Candidatus Omnitrophota bacterium]